MNTLLQENHVKYGLIMTAVTTVWILVMHATGTYSQPENDSTINLLFIVISLCAVWYLGIKAKKTLQKGKLTYKEGLLEGAKIAIVYGLTSPFVFALYYLTLNTGYLDTLRTTYNMLSEPIGMVIAVEMLAQLVASMIGGTILGAIISLFLKSSPAKSR